MKMHWEDLIEWTQRCTLRLCSSKLGHALASYDQMRLEEYFEGFHLEGGMSAAENLFIG
jgi:hypothetical protein